MLNASRLRGVQNSKEILVKYSNQNLCALPIVLTRDENHPNIHCVLNLSKIKMASPKCMHNWKTLRVQN